MPALVIAARRTGEAQADESIVAELMASERARTVHPDALSADEVETIVRARLPGAVDPSFVDACHRATGGVPFLVHELLGALHADRVEPTADAAARVAETGPGTVAHATALRISRVSPSAVSVARAVAILGPHTRVDRVAALAGVEQPEVQAAADALMDMDILVAGPPLAFVHPLVHRAVYDDMSAGQRAVAHGRAAELLHAQQAPLDEIAAHLLQSEPAGRSEVVEVLRDAAAATTNSRGAPAGAVAYLRRAVEEGASTPSRGVLLHELGMAASRTTARRPRASACAAAARDRSSTSPTRPSTERTSPLRSSPPRT